MKKVSTQSTDSDLLLLLAQSPEQAEAAFTEIYNRYAKSIYTFCVGITKNRDKANDVFQETFIRFYKSPSLTEISNLRAYLFRIARNLLYDGEKRTEREFVEDKNRLDIIPIDNNRYDNEELFRLLMAALELLDEKYREVFVLREFDGLAYNEIAELCGISLANAKITGIRARQKLLDILAPYVQDIQKFG